MENVKNKKKFTFIYNNYSLRSYSEKKTLWHEIQICTLNDNNCTWCIVGDFNIVKNFKKRKGKSQDGIIWKEIEDFKKLFGKFEIIWYTNDW